MLFIWIFEVWFALVVAVALVLWLFCSLCLWVVWCGGVVVYYGGAVDVLI